MQNKQETHNLKKQTHFLSTVIFTLLSSEQIQLILQFHQRQQYNVRKYFLLIIVLQHLDNSNSC